MYFRKFLIESQTDVDDLWAAVDNAITASHSTIGFDTIWQPLFVLSDAVEENGNQQLANKLRVLVRKKKTPLRLGDTFEWMDKRWGLPDKLIKKLLLLPNAINRENTFVYRNSPTYQRYGFTRVDFKTAREAIEGLCQVATITDLNRLRFGQSRSI